MGRPVDRDTEYMNETFGTSRLVTDYVTIQPSALKIEENQEALTALASSLRNSDDYDDWDYGTEPIPRDLTWTNKLSL